ncbi:hypothetical protein GCM10017786_13120 [Amycolatopsis deserti]|uniref:Uncharacterized protein n=1 Tax=Amycolatopsis deserti TaxID=185696 RepID=A0ABQ3II66_9PSEU|nr:hypothetical protein GCM10017786_13120 [Amycolatopsis deserti]
MVGEEPAEVLGPAGELPHLRADWMRRVLTVPYIPVLGATHPDLCTTEMFVEVFAEVLTASRAGVALPLDKDRRWSPTKADIVLTDEIVHRPDHTIIPVLSQRGGGTVRPTSTATPPTSTRYRRRHAAAASPTQPHTGASSGSAPAPPAKRTTPAYSSKTSTTQPPNLQQDRR